MFDCRMILTQSHHRTWEITAAIGFIGAINVSVAGPERQMYHQPNIRWREPTSQVIHCSSVQSIEALARYTNFRRIRTCDYIHNIDCVQFGLTQDSGFRSGSLQDMQGSCSRVPRPGCTIPQCSITTLYWAPSSLMAVHRGVAEIERLCFIPMPSPLTTS